PEERRVPLERGLSVPPVHVGHRAGVYGPPTPASPPSATPAATDAAPRSRSGTSRRASETRDAANPDRSTPLNTLWTQPENASTSRVRIGVGSSLKSAGFSRSSPLATFAVMCALAGKSLGSQNPSRFTKIEPKIATPKTPPIERKNVDADVAVPRSDGGTA